ncbi:MAG: DUF3179 domain-containing protein [Acidimicrobiales bacterium]
MRITNAIPIAVGFALIAVACSGGDDPDEAAADSADIVSAVDDSSTPADDVAPPVAAGSFDLPGIESTPREDVPSALDDKRDPSFPDPLVDVDAIRSGGPPPDGIPPIDDPLFENVGAVDWIGDTEPVMVIDIDGDARAYPIQVMTWHEIVNDTFGDRGVTVSYCPLCNSAIAYDRAVGDRVLDFGTSGSLFNSALVMYDRQTQSLWSHFTGQAIVGFLTGTTLDTIPVSTTSFASFREAHPEGIVLSRDTGFSRDYGRNPYPGYDDVGTNPFLFDGPVDGRLPAKAKVVVVRGDDGPAVAVQHDMLLDEQVVEFSAQGRDLVAVLERGTSSGLDQFEISSGRDVGATGVFVPEIDGVEVTLEPAETGFLDTSSGSTFDIFGRAIDGPLEGRQLEVVEHLDTFWFAIGAFDPETIVVGIDGRAERQNRSREVFHHGDHHGAGLRSRQLARGEPRPG